MGLCGEEVRSCCRILLQSVISHASVTDQLGGTRRRGACTCWGRELSWNGAAQPVQVPMAPLLSSLFKTVFLQGLPAPCFCPQGSENIFPSVSGASCRMFLRVIPLSGPSSATGRCACRAWPSAASCALELCPSQRQLFPINFILRKSCSFAMQYPNLNTPNT